MPLRWSASPANSADHVLLKFEIEDTGIGVAEEDQARIFKAFVQAAETHRSQGVGLGLTISRQLIELMGGSIHMESRPGRGSCFRVELPAELAPYSDVIAGDELRAVLALEDGQPECRILIVEDDRESSLLLERVLQNAGFAVLVAGDGAQAVERFRDWKPQFVWMDLQLPVIDGLEAARRIRACEKGSEAKIVALTASGFVGSRSDVIAGGFDDYLHKPYRPEDVFACMERHLGVRYTRKQAAEATNAQVEEGLRLDDLGELHDDMRRELREALIALDSQQITVVIQRISEKNATLGSKLASYAGRTAYTPIIKALDTVHSPAGST
jgi:DNA-binding response OmpR family regulator